MNIEIRDISKRFGRQLALDAVSFNVAGGGIVGVLGPSGSGKTTLLRCIAGLIRPEQGLIFVGGHTPDRKELKPRIGYMAQEDALYGDLSGEENLAYFASLVGLRGEAKASRIGWALEFTGLAADASKAVHHYSGGMRKRLSLAIALIHDPELLILDEPTVGIDPLLRAKFWQEFKRQGSQGKTILVSTHVMDEAERCDRLALIFDGHLLAYDRPVRIMEAQRASSVEEAFLSIRKVGSDD
jgi:ABC-type multidrug transport system, ATPase component